MRFFLALVVIAACSVTIGRILSVPGPFGPNDLSRWATIAALVETGGYSIGRRVQNPDGTYRDLKPPVNIDVLLDPETNQFYSSKPPLLPTILAGEMLAMQRIGWTPQEHGARMLRVMLLTSNALPIALYLIALLFLLERSKASDRTSAILMIAAGFGTLLTAFATSLTNHVGATAGACLALYAVARIWNDRDLSPKWFVLAGLGAGWCASQEVPALSLIPVLALALWMRSPRSTLAIFLPCSLVPLSAFWVTNHLALGDPFWFYHPDPIWSKFPGSYWTQKVGIDRGESSSIAYVFHFTFGHHGVFSLSPIFLLSFAGMLRLQRYHPWLTALALALLAVVMRYLYRELSIPLPLALAPFVLIAAYLLRKQDDLLLRLSAALTLVTFGFYLIHTSNYGGVSCGPRWLMWLLPFWTIAAIGPLEERKKPILICAALAISIFSASHPALNPWTHPWLYDLFRALPSAGS